MPWRAEGRGPLGYCGWLTQGWAPFKSQLPTWGTEVKSQSPEAAQNSAGRPGNCL